MSLKHPEKTGKVSISHSIKGSVRPGSELFKSILRQAGMTRQEFEKLYFDG